MLINALSARRGGGQTYLVNLLKFLPKDVAAEIFVLAPDSLEIPAERAEIKRISVRWPVENPIVRAVWERLRLPKLMRKLDANVLFCPGGIVGAHVPDGCKCVTMFRNMIPLDAIQRRRYPLGYMRMRNWILRRVMLCSMLRADLVIFLSEFAKRVVEEQSAGRLKEAVVIPHGIHPMFRTGDANPPQRPDWLPPGEYLLYASNVDFYKAQVEVVQAFALLKQRRVTTEKLVIVGPEFPPYARLVRAEIARLGLQQDVLLKGIVPYEQMPALYRHAVLNIFASECENCPNILLEALAAGRPVVVSHCPPMPEFAADAVVYFDPRSPEQLMDAMSKLLSDPILMSELAERAREGSLLYDWQRTAQETWSAIEQLSRS